MTIAEMVDFYNGYKFKKDALAILARQTGMDQDGVKKALKIGGVSWRSLPRDRAPTTESTRARMAASAKKRWARKRKPAELEPVEPTEADREAFRFVFGGFLPGVEPL